MPLNKIETHHLATFLDDLSVRMGNAGCNDWQIPATAENIAWINSVHDYGVKHNLWDEECSSTIRPDCIIWTDFMIVAYLRHRILNTGT